MCWKVAVLLLSLSVALNVSAGCCGSKVAAALVPAGESHD